MFLPQVCQLGLHPREGHPGYDQSGYDNPVSAYRLRRAGREFLVIDRESLVQMALNGQVRNGDEAWFQERWQPAGALPELKGKLDKPGKLEGIDPWEAWDEGEDGSADDALARFQGPVELDAIPVLDMEALAPVPPRLTLRTRPKPVSPPPAVERAADSEGDVDDDGEDELPEGAVNYRSEPTAAGSGSAGGGRADAGGQIIAFPTPRPRVLPLMPPNTPRSGAPLVRASRVFGFLMLGGAVLGIGYLWMFTVSSTRGVQQPVARPAATTEPVLLRPTADSSAGDPSRDLLASLRGRLPQEVQSVRSPQDLEDAMLIELQNLESGVDLVTAEITRWTGPKIDQPREGRVTVTFRDIDNLERDQAAFGLVLGRYMRAYSMDISEARLVFHTPNGDQGREVSAKSALELYNGGITLKAYLAE